MTSTRAEEAVRGRRGKSTVTVLELGDLIWSRKWTVIQSLHLSRGPGLWWGALAAFFSAPAFPSRSPGSTSFPQSTETAGPVGKRSSFVHKHFTLHLYWAFLIFNDKKLIRVSLRLVPLGLHLCFYHQDRRITDC